MSKADFEAKVSREGQWCVLKALADEQRPYSKMDECSVSTGRGEMSADGAVGNDSRVWL